MIHQQLVINSFILMAGCAPAVTKPIQSPSVETTDASMTMPIIQSWEGRIYISEMDSPKTNHSEPTLLVIRNESDLKSFVARIPKHEIQKRQPAPKSKDPILNGINIDFNSDMLIVLIRSQNMYADAPIKRIDRKLDETIVYYQLTDIGNTNKYASMVGIGTYNAIKTKRVNGNIKAENE